MKTESRIITRQDLTVKGTRITVGNSKRNIINKMINFLTNQEFTEIEIPIIQHEHTFENKIGSENNLIMYRFKDRGNRDLVLSPEYTSVVQQLAFHEYKYEKDVKLFYVSECFRAEQPQKGRYRQFTQLGVEILNPTKNYDLGYLCLDMLYFICTQEMLENRIFALDTNVKRGLDFYKDGNGFEIVCEQLGAQKQIAGGGEYEGGVGFAIGISRLMTLFE